MDITDKIRTILINEFAADADTLKSTDRLVDDLGMDSVELMEFAMLLEEAFDVEINDDMVTASMTVGEVVEAVRKLKG